LGAIKPKGINNNKSKGRALVFMLYISVTVRVFNNDNNSYPKMSVMLPPAVVWYSLLLLTWASLMF
jgi:hypothetical protein